MIIAKVELTQKNQIRFVSLVKKPAIDLDFLKMEEEFVDNRQVIPDELIPLIIEYLTSVGKTLKQIEDEEGLILDEIQEEELGMVIHSYPNRGSAEDQYTNGKLTKQYRFYYTGPYDDDNRMFCRKVLDLNYWYRKEDIDNINSAVENPKFGSYSIWDYRGSYGCRHKWTKRSFSPSMKFNKELKLAYNDKQDIVGPVLIPNKYYYRGKKFFGGEEDGYIFFNKQTVKDIAMDFLNNTNNDFNLDHDNEKILTKEDISLIESWIVESEKDKIYDLGFTIEQIPIGTWCMKQHINNSNIWDSIKAGDYNGFSIQGFPTVNIIATNVDLEKEQKEEKLANEIVSLIKEYKLIK